MSEICEPGQTSSCLWALVCPHLLHGEVNAPFVGSWRSERKEPAMVPEREKAFHK